MRLTGLGRAITLLSPQILISSRITPRNHISPTIWAPPCLVNLTYEITIILFYVKVWTVIILLHARVTSHRSLTKQIQWSQFHFKQTKSTAAQRMTSLSRRGRSWRIGGRDPLCLLTTQSEWACRWAGEWRSAAGANPSACVRMTAGWLGFPSFTEVFFLFGVGI